MSVTSSLSSTRAIPRTPIVLIVLSLAAGLLGIYQWVELIHLRNGGTPPLCSINATFNCAGVWNSPLSDKIHAMSGIPLVGWGLSWSLIVLILALSLLYQTYKALPAGNTILALRLTTGVGVLVSLLLLGYSAAIKIFCPTCVLLYLLVAAAAYIAFARLKTHDTAWTKAGLTSIALLAVTLAVLLYPGLNTPREDLMTAQIAALAKEDNPSTQVSPPVPASPLEAFLNSLPLNVQQLTSNALAVYRKAQLVPVPPDPKRLIFGAPQAPVQLVEWIDIRCPHCKHMEEALAGIREKSPPGSWSIEARHYPLDSECNPNVQRSGGGISCLSAKVLICLNGSPQYDSVRSTLFQEQATLTEDRIWEIVAQDPERRQALESCANSPATAATLDGDIKLAGKYQIEGTPLIVINNRTAAAAPSLIYGLILARGNDEDPGFLVLPAPNPETSLP